MAVLINDGQGEQFVLLQQPRRLLLVDIRLHRHQLGVHQLADGPLRLAGDQRAQPQHPLEVSVLVGDVEVEWLLLVRARAAQGVEGARDCEFGRDGDQLAGHAAAGGVLGVVEQRLASRRVAPRTPARCRSRRRRRRRAGWPSRPSSVHLATSRRGSAAQRSPWPQRSRRGRSRPASLRGPRPTGASASRQARPGAAQRPHRRAR